MNAIVREFGVHQEVASQETNQSHRSSTFVLYAKCAVRFVELRDSGHDHVSGNVDTILICVDEDEMKMREVLIEFALSVRAERFSPADWIESEFSGHIFRNTSLAGAGINQ